MIVPALQPVFVAGMGAATSVGHGAWASAAAVRAGISGFVQHPFMIDTAGEPMRAAIVPWLDINLGGTERFKQLLIPPIEEALAALGDDPQCAGRLAVALALPGARPALPENLAPSLLRQLHARFGSVLASATIFEHGHAAGLIGLQVATQKIHAGELDGCVVAGVDSWLEPLTLEWLERCDQLHGAGARNNAWGFVPGEAGAALLLLGEAKVRELAIEPLATVLSVASAHEPKRIKTDTVCIGEGLTTAFRSALSNLPAGALISDVYGDMNGEPYRADEFGFTALRVKEHFESLPDFVAPADCWGDVSAAGSLLHVMLACAAARKRYARGPLALVHASAEMGERAAALLAFAHVGGRV